MPEKTQDNYRRILKEYWGYDDFRGIQREIIESIGAGHDTLGLMPTGGGKSITFQVPALAMEGVCLVITPLIALMKDQVQHLRKRGILAAAIYSGMRHDQIIQTLENAIFGGVKVLYVSPERLASEFFLTKISHAKVSFITVDEAHCISQWGYDFRPSYLAISKIRQHLGADIPVLALTATATPQVIDDIKEKLEFRSDANVFKMSFSRDNLAYVVRKAEDKKKEMLHILSHVNGSAIVYTRSRTRTKEISEFLNDNGIVSTFYHAGLDHVQKDERQEQWQNDVKRVMVATNAFGMGIDKPDVRIVIHYDCPDSLEAYFQEAGRAGRDGFKSFAVLLYNGSDKVKLQRRIAETFPEKDYIRKVYEHLAYYYQIAYQSHPRKIFDFDIDEFCRNFKHFPVQTDSALKILQRAGYICYEEETESMARVKFLISRYRLDEINNLDGQTNRLIITLLRNYGSMFTDYVYINESFIAKQMAMTIDEVYQILKELSRRNIIHFIPKKKTPTIEYTRYREDPDKLEIPASVYEERKAQFSERIWSVIHYATNDNVCRSRQLLRYFGEESTEDCMKCDVCLKSNVSEAIFNESEESKVIEFLADGKFHSFEELYNINIPEEELNRILERLIEEEIIQPHSLGVIYVR